MKEVFINSKIRLGFTDGDGEYTLTPVISGKLNEVSSQSPLGKALFGKTEGDSVEIYNSMGEKVKVKILKIME